MVSRYQTFIAGLTISVLDLGVWLAFPTPRRFLFDDCSNSGFLDRLTLAITTPALFFVEDALRVGIAIRVTTE